MLVDTHCHLDDSSFDADRDAVLERARAAGVARIVVPAVSPSNFGAVAALAHRAPDVRYALGVHPMYVASAGERALDALRAAVTVAVDDPRFVAIGEIGLDHFVPGLDRALQLEVFVAQLRLAREFDLPVILHVRRAQDPVLRELRRWRPRSGIAHAFNGSAQQADAFVGLGFALGFGGAMTFTRALQIRRLATSLALDACVLETDAPDIPPAWQSGGRNEPAQVAPIAAALATLRDEPPAAVIAATARTAQRVLPRLDLST
jgi:TatD DNase family protein